MSRVVGGGGGGFRRAMGNALLHHRQLCNLQRFVVAERHIARLDEMIPGPCERMDFARGDVRVRTRVIRWVADVIAEGHAPLRNHRCDDGIHAIVEVGRRATGQSWFNRRTCHIHG